MLYFLGQFYLSFVAWLILGSLLWFLNTTLFINLLPLLHPKDFAKDTSGLTRGARVGEFVLTSGIIGLAATVLLGSSLASILPADRSGHVEWYVLLGIPAALIAVCSVAGVRYYRDHRTSSADNTWTEWLGERHWHHWNALLVARILRNLSIVYYVLIVFAALFRSRNNEALAAFSQEDAVPTGQAAALLGSVILFITGTVVLFKLWSRTSPHLQIAQSYLSYADLDARKNRAIDTGFRATRWRSSYHRLGFDVARNVERCLGGLQHRLTADQHQIVANVYGRLASSLRRTGLAASDCEDSKQHIRKLLHAAIALIAAPSPVEAATRTEQLVHDEPKIEMRPPASRFRHSIESGSDLILLHWPTIKIVAFLIAAGVLLASGEVGQVLNSLINGA